MYQITGPDCQTQDPMVTMPATHSAMMVDLAVSVIFGPVEFLGGEGSRLDRLILGQNPDRVECVDHPGEQPVEDPTLAAHSFTSSAERRAIARVSPLRLIISWVIGVPSS